MSTLNKYIRQFVELYSEDGMLTMTAEFALDIAGEIEKLAARQVPEGLVVETCDRCKGQGEGKLGPPEYDGVGYFYPWAKCETCRGTGKLLVKASGKEGDDDADAK